MKHDSLYKRAFNEAVSLLAARPTGAVVPSESTLSGQMAVSRTTVRKVLGELEERGFLAARGRRRVIRKSPTLADAFPDTETVSASAQIEPRFMEWMLRGDLRPGASINTLELARQFGVSTTLIRDFLNRFAHYGLIERRPNASWVFKGLTRAFALELFDVREMFELRAARAFIDLPADHPAWAELRELRREHHELLRDIERRYHDFSALDSRLHQLIGSAAENRFIDGFHDIIAFIFHYHYQWNKQLQKQRNAAALVEHIRLIDALGERRVQPVQQALRDHLATARKTLLASLLPE